MQAVEREQHASLCRDSLYFIMASTALGSGIVPGLACSYPFGIISNMKRTMVNLLCFLLVGQAARRWGAQPGSARTSNAKQRNRQRGAGSGRSASYVRLL